MTLTRSTCSSKSRCTRCWVRGTEARLRVAERHGQTLGRRQDPGFGGMRRRLAGERLGLAEVGDVLRALPFRRRSMRRRPGPRGRQPPSRGDSTYTTPFNPTLDSPFDSP